MSVRKPFWKWPPTWKRITPSIIGASCTLGSLLVSMHSLDHQPQGSISCSRTQPTFSVVQWFLGMLNRIPCILWRLPSIATIDVTKRWKTTQVSKVEVWVLNWFQRFSKLWQLHGNLVSLSQCLLLHWIVQCWSNNCFLHPRTVWTVLSLLVLSLLAQSWPTTKPWSVLPPPMVESIRPKLEHPAEDAQAEIPKPFFVPRMYYILGCGSGLGPLFSRERQLHQSICWGEDWNWCFNQEVGHRPHGRGNGRPNHNPLGSMNKYN